MSKLRLGVLIDPIKPDYRDNDIQAYRYDLVTVNDKDQVRNPSTSAWGEEAGHTKVFADLSFRGQGAVVNTQEADSYGWSLEYRNVHSVDLERAEMMVKMLRKIRKVKMPIYPTTYGQYMQLMCQAVGITLAVQQRGPSRGWHYENDYAIFKATDIQSLVDRSITEFLQEQRKANGIVVAA